MDEKIITLLIRHSGFTRYEEARAYAEAIWRGLSEAGYEIVPSAEIAGLREELAELHKVVDVTMRANNDHHAERAALRARVAELEAQQQWRPTHKHVVSGGLYQEIGVAELQAKRSIDEGALLTLYQGEDKRLWVRPLREFHDGRFEPLPTPPEKQP